MGDIADAVWRPVLALARLGRRRLGLPAPAAPAHAAGASWEDLRRERERRWRNDLLLAVATGLVVAFGILVVAGSVPERTSLVVVSQQIWWLAGAFWGGVVFLMRRWLS